MKTTKTFLIFCSALLLIRIEAKAQISEITVNNAIYIYNKEKKSIYNKRNSIENTRPKPKFNYNCSAAGKISFLSVSKDLFSFEKVQALAKERKLIMLTYYCDTTGTILEVSFYLNQIDLETVTVLDINALEHIIVGSKVELSGICTDVKYYRLFQPFWFEDLLEEMLKSKAAQSVS